MKFVEDMTRKEFQNLPVLSDSEDVLVTSLVLIPTRKRMSRNDNGYSYFEVVLCKDGIPIGKTYRFDTHDLICYNGVTNYRIDLLTKSNLFRILLRGGLYFSNTRFYYTKKGE